LRAQRYSTAIGVADKRTPQDHLSSCPSPRLTKCQFSTASAGFSIAAVSAMAYYGAWWQNILKEDRTLITINRQPTAELDFRCMQPQLAYASVEV
jgi:hypothetical protein